MGRAGRASSWSAARATAVGVGAIEIKLKEAKGMAGDLRECHDVSEDVLAAIQAQYVSRPGAGMEWPALSLARAMSVST